MRHLNAINHLGRKSADRKAMMANLASSLILHKRITTTNAKARALRRYVEPLITKSKDDSTHSRRMVFSYLENKTAVSELFREVAPRIASRPGGYTRILKMGNRLGDSAEMCLIELVDFNENMLAGEGGKAKTTRRRRSPKKKAETVAEPRHRPQRQKLPKQPPHKRPHRKETPLTLIQKNSRICSYTEGILSLGPYPFFHKLQIIIIKI